jgi:hypothetical protein
MAETNDYLTGIMDVLRSRRQNMIHDVELLTGVITALEAMTPEFRQMVLNTLARAIPSPLASGTISNIQVAPTRGELKNMTYADAVDAVLSRVNRQPLSTKVLLARLEAGGRKVGGSDPYRVLYRTLQKNPRFVNVSGRWALADWYSKSEATHGAEDSQKEGIA